MIRILIDSSSDYLPQDAAKRGIDVIPLVVILDGREYRDGENLDRDEFYQMVERTGCVPKTSQNSPLVFSDYFKAAVEAGDEVIYLSLAADLSGTNGSAQMAADLVDASRIHVVNSTTATACIRILADHAADLRDAGKSVEEILASLEDVKKRVRCLAGLDTLDWLARGGRIPQAVATAAGAVNVKPQIMLRGEGVSVMGVNLGMNRAISSAAKELKKTAIDTDFPFYVIYSYGQKNSDKFREKIDKLGIEVTDTLQIGCTIGTHMGPDAFGCVYVQK